jgi:hypothetical protein
VKPTVRGATRISWWILLSRMPTHISQCSSCTTGVVVAPLPGPRRTPDMLQVPEMCAWESQLADDVITTAGPMRHHFLLVSRATLRQRDMPRCNHHGLLCFTTQEAHPRGLIIASAALEFAFETAGQTVPVCFPSTVSDAAPIHGFSY